MLTLLRDPDMAREMGRDAQTHIEANFSRERVLENLETFYDSMTRESRCDLAVS